MAECGLEFRRKCAREDGDDLTYICGYCTDGKRCDARADSTHDVQDKPRRGHQAQDGRESVHIRARLTPNEQKLIQDNLTTDERRQALMRAVERKER